MRTDSIITLSDQLILNIDTTVRQLMQLRNNIENIKKDCSELRSLAGVSTPAPDEGAAAAIAIVLNNREKTRAKRRTE